MRISWSLVPLAIALSACAADVDAEDGDDFGESADSLSGTTKKQIQYVVTAHPDDELASWSLIEKSPANYPVFIVLTQGERTAYCEASGRAHWQPDLGEARPGAALPYTGRGSSECRDARIASWHRFLDTMAQTDSALSKGPPLRRTITEGGRSFRVWADGKSARVAFDLGDGNLTASEVTWAIQAVRSRRAQLFPLTKEYGVIAASYSNLRRDIGCEVYDHPDHRAVHAAIWSTNQGTPGPQWGRTCVNDPDVRGTGGRIEEIDSDTFSAALGVDAPSWDPARYPDARRRGAFQVHYGWLRPAYWESGRGGTTQMDKRQAFWRRF